MEDKNYILDELQEISPLLAKMKQEKPKEGYQTPKFYFEASADKVLQRIKTEDAPKVAAKTENGIWVAIQSLFALRSAAMAMAVLLISFSIFYFSPKVNNNDTALAQNLSKEEITAYIQENIDDFDETMLIENSSMNINEEEKILDLQDEDLDLLESEL